SYRKCMFIFFSKRGWRKNEPGIPYPAETTWLFPRLVYRAFSEDYIGESKAAELLGKSLREFRQDSDLEYVNADTH
ncbi:transcriptional regulator, partial [Gilvimarinus sp. SDUM040013]|nr:transcriptional regulator [Gilvimarinus sp. SDUM040013]